MADTKISALTAVGSLAGADLFAVVDDTDTTTKRATITQLQTFLAALQNVVEDTTPQLGGDLDAQSNKVTSLGAPTANGDGARLQDARTQWIGIALSDETTAITTGTNKATMSLPFACTVLSVYATLNTASSSGLPTVDINEGGTTILSTKLTIDANEKTSATAATAAVISDSAIAANAEIGFDIDVAGTGAKGLKVFMRVQEAV